MATLTKEPKISSQPIYYRPDLLDSIPKWWKNNDVTYSMYYWKAQSRIPVLKYSRSRLLKINLENFETISLPFELIELYNAIKESRYILDFEDNWDDQGAKKYLSSTWAKSINFITNYAKWIFDERKVIIPIPKIYHGPHGSIDIQWKNDDFKLLINIPEEDTNASFYGNFGDNQEIEGNFSINNYKLQLLPSLISI